MPGTSPGMTICGVLTFSSTATNASIKDLMADLNDA
jgi:hypothetical protein